MKVLAHVRAAASLVKHEASNAGLFTVDLNEVPSVAAARFRLVTKLSEIVSSCALVNPSATTESPSTFASAEAAPCPSSDVNVVTSSAVVNLRTPVLTGAPVVTHGASGMFGSSAPPPVP